MNEKNRNVGNNNNTDKDNKEASSGNDCNADCASKIDAGNNKDLGGAGKASTNAHIYYF